MTEQAKKTRAAKKAYRSMCKGVLEIGVLKIAGNSEFDKPEGFDDNEKQKAKFNHAMKCGLIEKC